MFFWGIVNKKNIFQIAEMPTAVLVALLLPAAIFTVGLMSDDAIAKVKGECVNCHTTKDAG